MTDRKQRARRVVLQLTLARIVATPAVMALILYWPEEAWAVAGAAVLFTAAAATDFIDGRLARRWNATTALGAFLDTTADKLLVTGVLLALVAVGRTSAWIAAVIVGRELIILALRGVVATSGDVMQPSVWGKLKTNIQFVAIVLAILRPPIELGPFHLDEWVMGAAAAATIWSGAEYFLRFVSGTTRVEQGDGRP